MTVFTGKAQDFEVAWEIDLLQAMIEFPAHCQLFEATWPIHSLFHLADLQFFQAIWPDNSLQALIVFIRENQPLEATRQCHILQALVEPLAELKLFEAAL